MKLNSHKCDAWPNCNCCWNHWSWVVYRLEGAPCFGNIGLNLFPKQRCGMARRFKTHQFQRTVDVFTLSDIEFLCFCTSNTISLESLLGLILYRLSHWPSKENTTLDQCDYLLVHCKSSPPNPKPNEVLSAIVDGCTPCCVNSLYFCTVTSSVQSNDLNHLTAKWHRYSERVWRSFVVSDLAPEAAELD